MMILIAAIDENNLIGCDDRLPWHLPEDFAHFKKTTLNHPIIMGRKTYDSLPVRPLPKRVNIVVTRSDSVPEGSIMARSLEEAAALAKQHSDRYFVIGGQSIYEQSIETADKLLITHVRGKHDGNYYFPAIDPVVWEPSEPFMVNDEFYIIEYSRKVIDQS